jgi:hypothetical protein
MTDRKSRTSRRRLDVAFRLRSLFASPPSLGPHNQSAVSRLNLLHQIPSVSIENTIGIRSPKGLYGEADPKRGYPVCPLHIRFLPLCYGILSLFGVDLSKDTPSTVLKAQILKCVKNILHDSLLHNFGPQLVWSQVRRTYM